MEFRIETVQGRVRPATDTERQQARGAIGALARPRLTGSSGAVQAEAELRRRFEGLGYQIRELPFEFSTWPGRFGVPAAGALYLLDAAIAVQLLLRGDGEGATVALLVAAGFLALFALLGRAAIAGLPWGRVVTSNWLVHRPDSRPRYLVMAHRDSKSQPISTFMRTAAIAMALFAWTALLGLAVVTALDPALGWAPLVLGTGVLAGAAGLLLLLLCRAENESPGALDNATGLAALLGVARRERERDDIAFLVTDAEELGLAGAWAIARQLPPPVLGVINLDGLDDDGSFFVIERFGFPRRGLAPHLAAALLSSATALQFPAERRDLPFGVLVDHIPFVRAGHPAVTMMRGSARSLRRVHRPEDSADKLTGRGVAATIAVVSGALQLLRGASPG